MIPMIEKRAAAADIDQFSRRGEALGVERHAERLIHNRNRQNPADDFCDREHQFHARMIIHESGNRVARGCDSWIECVTTLGAPKA